MIDYVQMSTSAGGGPFTLLASGTGEQAGSRFDARVGSVGDLNGDGYQDWQITAPLYNSSTGRAYILFGGSVLDMVPDAVITGSAAELDSLTG